MHLDDEGKVPKVNNIALFANHLPGLWVAEFLGNSSPDDLVKVLYLTGNDLSADQKIIDTLSIPQSNIFVGPEHLKNEDHIAWLSEQGINTIICVYWPWLLAEDMFTIADKTINFHPALLPINRGWFPHVHSLLDGSKTGVTLHKIEKGADTGDIWAQKEVLIQPTDTAKDIYDRLQVEIFTLFKEKWCDIKSNNIQPFPQNEDMANYHAKGEIGNLDRIDINASYKGKDLINKLRARTFGNKGFSYFEIDGEKFYINIKISKTCNFK
jgi:methionyl-tRNA formyltransferase